MNIDFTYENPTRIHFGKTALEHLSGELANYGKNVLLVYGKASIKKIGLYDEVISILEKAGKNVVELEGIRVGATKRFVAKFSNQLNFFEPIKIGIYIQLFHS